MNRRQCWQFPSIFVLALYHGFCQNHMTEAASHQNVALIEVSAKTDASDMTAGKKEIVPIGVEMPRKLRIGDEIGIHSRLDSSSSEESESIVSIVTTGATRRATRKMTKTTTTAIIPGTKLKSEDNTAAPTENVLIRASRSTEIATSTPESPNLSVNDLTYAIAESMKHSRSKRQTTRDYVGLDDFRSVHDIDATEVEDDDMYNYINLDADSASTSKPHNVAVVTVKVLDESEQSDSTKGYNEETTGENLENKKNNTLKTKAHEKDSSQQDSISFSLESETTERSLKSSIKKLKSLVKANQYQSSTSSSEEKTDKISSKNESSQSEEIMVIEIVDPKDSDETLLILRSNTTLETNKGNILGDFSEERNMQKKTRKKRNAAASMNKMTSNLDGGDMTDVRKTAGGMAYTLNFADKQREKSEDRVRRWVTRFHRTSSTTPVNENTVDDDFLRVTPKPTLPTMNGDEIVEKKWNCDCKTLSERSKRRIGDEAAKLDDTSSDGSLENNQIKTRKESLSAPNVHLQVNFIEQLNNVQSAPLSNFAPLSGPPSRSLASLPPFRSELNSESAETALHPPPSLFGSKKYLSLLMLSGGFSDNVPSLHSSISQQTNHAMLIRRDDVSDDNTPAFVTPRRLPSSLLQSAPTSPSWLADAEVKRIPESFTSSQAINILVASVCITAVVISALSIVARRVDTHARTKIAVTDTL